MEQKVERKPLLSDEVIATGGDIDNPRAMTAWNVRAFYEGLIDRGELFTKEEHQRIVREREDNAMFRWSDP